MTLFDEKETKGSLRFMESHTKEFYDGYNAAVADIMANIKYRYNQHYRNIMQSEGNNLSQEMSDQMFHKAEEDEYILAALLQNSFLLNNQHIINTQI